ncbi:MAG: hypothetical protein ABIO16_13795, partial [Nocardioides sp.]
ISGDGRYVVALSPRRQVRADRNIYTDLYRIDRARGKGVGRVELLSRGADGKGLTLGCDIGPLDVSHDGRYVVASCRDGRLFDPPIPHKHSHLTLFDTRTDRHTLLNPNDLEDSYASAAAVSDDGRTVFFGSSEGPFAGTPPEVGPDVYRWRRRQGVTLVSVGNDSVYRWWGYQLDLSADGDTAVFESDSPLVPGDNERGVLDPDVYTVRLGR